MPYNCEKDNKIKGLRLKTKVVRICLVYFCQKAVNGQSEVFEN